MSNRTVTLRAATASDDASLARLINYAGEGLPLHFWKRLARDEGVDESEVEERAWAIGRSRARREEGSFSYRTATIAMRDGAVAGLLIDYRIDDDAEPEEETGPPTIFGSIQALEDSAPGTHYVCVLAVEPEHRGQGVGTQLLRAAERAADGCDLSLIVVDANTGARRLYERFGFSEAMRRTMVKEDWDNPGSELVLMIRPAR